MTIVLPKQPLPLTGIMSMNYFHDGDVSWRVGLVQAVESYHLWSEGLGFESRSPRIVQTKVRFATDTIPQTPHRVGALWLSSPFFFMHDPWPLNASDYGLHLHGSTVCRRASECWCEHICNSVSEWFQPYICNCWWSKSWSVQPNRP